MAQRGCPCGPSFVEHPLLPGQQGVQRRLFQTTHDKAEQPPCQCLSVPCSWGLSVTPKIRAEQIMKNTYIWNHSLQGILFKHHEWCGVFSQFCRRNGNRCFHTSYGVELCPVCHLTVAVVRACHHITQVVPGKLLHSADLPYLQNHIPS